MGLRIRALPGEHAIDDRVDEQLASLITQVTNEITWYMSERGLTRADLAGRMGVSPGRVSQVLSGGENLTLRTLAGVLAALDARFEMQLAPREPVADGGDVSQLIEQSSDALIEDYRPLQQVDRPQEAADAVHIRPVHIRH